jgi:hypothetical protein
MNETGQLKLASDLHSLTHGLREKVYLNSELFEYFLILFLQVIYIFALSFSMHGCIEI